MKACLKMMMALVFVLASLQARVVSAMDATGDYEQAVKQRLADLDKLDRLNYYKTLFNYAFRDAEGLHYTDWNVAKAWADKMFLNQSATRAYFGLFREAYHFARYDQSGPKLNHVGSLELGLVMAAYGSVPRFVAWHEGFLFASSDPQGLQLGDKDKAIQFADSMAVSSPYEDAAQSALTKTIEFRSAWRFARDEKEGLGLTDKGKALAFAKEHTKLPIAGPELLPNSAAPEVEAPPAPVPFSPGEEREFQKIVIALDSGERMYFASGWYFAGKGEIKVGDTVRFDPAQCREIAELLKAKHVTYEKAYAVVEVTKPFDNGSARTGQMALVSLPDGRYFYVPAGFFKGKSPLVTGQPAELDPINFGIPYQALLTRFTKLYGLELGRVYPVERVRWTELPQHVDLPVVDTGLSQAPAAPAPY